MVNRAALLAVGVVALFAILVGAVGGGYALTDWAIARSQRQWCSALELLTSLPVSPPANPAANPSRVGQYRLYEDFVAVRQQFGC